MKKYNITETRNEIILRIGYGLFGGGACLLCDRLMKTYEPLHIFLLVAIGFGLVVFGYLQHRHYINKLLIIDEPDKKKTTIIELDEE